MQGSLKGPCYFLLLRTLRSTCLNLSWRPLICLSFSCIIWYKPCTAAIVTPLASTLLKSCHFFPGRKRPGSLAPLLRYVERNQALSCNSTIGWESLPVGRE